MFTQPITVPTPSGLIGSTNDAPTPSSPASPTSTSRLRGLSYLRNYTQARLLSRDHSSPPRPHQPGAPTDPPLANPNSNPSGPSGRPSLVPTPSAASAAPRSTTATSITASATTSSVTPSTATANGPRRPVHHYPSSTSAPDLDLASTDLALPSSASFSSSSRLAPVGSASHPLASSTAPGGQSTESFFPPPPPLPPPAPPSSAPLPSPAMTRTRSATATDAASGQPGLDVSPSIRFSTFYDPRAARPSLTFTPVSRTLPTGSEIIRVGRYSERDNQPTIPPHVPSAAPVGFKSKVVSRRHCEFWYEAGKWYIRDVKSSSGTFLNHIRLSPPGTESKPFPVNDGDIVQLGIDFKGGEEMIFRCVKMRLELNRGWQNKLNAFNMTTHRRLLNMAAGAVGGAAGQTYSQDCSICLNRIAPCQCLFVAPCSHTWHYKCIRSLLSSPSYPIFICPNCRAAADLEAEVEDLEQDWEQLDSDDADNKDTTQQQQQQQQQQDGVNPGSGAASIAAPRASRESSRSVRAAQNAAAVAAAAAAATSPGLPKPQPSPDLVEVTMQFDSPPAPPLGHNSNSRRSDTPPSIRDGSNPPGKSSTSHATSEPVPIPTASSFFTPASRGGSGLGRARGSSAGPTAGGNNGNDDRAGTRTPSPTGVNPALIGGPEGPITPRNNAGPWVFDGSGSRSRSGGGGTSGVTPGTAAAVAAQPPLISLDAAANGDDEELPDA